MTDVTEDRDQDSAELSAADEQLLRELTERARAGGLKLTGEGGLLGKLTKMVIGGALEGELDDHLGLLEATVPSPHDHPQRQTDLRPRRHQAEDGVTGSTRQSSTSPASPAAYSPSVAATPRLDNPPGIRHPGTGHGAGRRTGSTLVATNAGP
jgi:hypothetical protein